MRTIDIYNLDSSIAGLSDRAVQFIASDAANRLIHTNPSIFELMPYKVIVSRFEAIIRAGIGATITPEELAAKLQAAQTAAKNGGPAVS